MISSSPSLRHVISFPTPSYMGGPPATGGVTAAMFPPYVVAPVAPPPPFFGSHPLALQPMSTTPVDHRRLKENIKEIYVAYLNNLQELAERGEEEESTPKAKERRHLLEEEIRDYCCQIPHAHKYFLGPSFELIVRQTIEDGSVNFSSKSGGSDSAGGGSRTSFEPLRTSEAFRALEKYAINVLLQPWREEFQKIKLYGGFFRHKVSRHISQAEGILELMGYVRDDANPQTMKLRPSNRLRRSSTSLPLVDKDDVTLVALDCLIANMETQIILLLMSSLRECKYTCGDIYRARCQLSGISMAETIFYLRHLSPPDNSAREWLRYEEALARRGSTGGSSSHLRNAIDAGKMMSRDNRRSRRDIFDDEVNKMLELSQRYLDDEELGVVAAGGRRSTSTAPNNGITQVAHRATSIDRIPNTTSGGSTSRYRGAGLEYQQPPLSKHHTVYAVTGNNLSAGKPSYTTINSPLAVQEPGPSLLDADLSPVGSYGTVLKPKRLTPPGGVDVTRKPPTSEEATRSRIKAVDELMRHLSLENESPPNRHFMEERQNSEPLTTSSLTRSRDNMRARQQQQPVVVTSQQSRPGSAAGNNASSGIVIPLLRNGTSSNNGGSKGTNGMLSSSAVGSSTGNSRTVLTSIGGVVVGGSGIAATSPCDAAAARLSAATTSASPTFRNMAASASTGSDAPPEVGVTEVVDAGTGNGAASGERRVAGGSATWACAACTFINATGVDVCEMCSKSRNIVPETPLVSGGKECPRCTLINDRQAAKCSACDNPLRDSPTYI